jgi:hypothetical protein
MKMRQQNTGSESNREPQIDAPTGFSAEQRTRRTNRLLATENGDGSVCLSFFGTTGDAQSPQVK